MIRRINLTCEKCGESIENHPCSTANNHGGNISVAPVEITSSGWMDALTEEVARTMTEIRESRYAFSRTKAIEKLQELHLRMMRRLKGSWIQADKKRLIFHGEMCREHNAALRALQKKNKELEKKLRIECEVTESIKRLDQAKSPFCEHNQQYLWSPDGKGKTIVCMRCKTDALQQRLVKAEAVLRRIADDKEFSHGVNGEFVRKVWYVEEAKRYFAASSSADKQ